ncbi:MAG: hypothetical protein CMN30_18215 [Sandaracinus sp.]|mgnify:CR=1 FL=1|nr:hypothetical protein [Sandaracinus sp.]
MNAPQLRPVVLALVALAAVACGDDDTSVVTDAGTTTDAARDMAPTIPDGSVLCETDEDCDDDIECTRDVCDGRGVCTYRLDPGVCDDGIFCNGSELCDPTLGCVPGTPETCNDDDVCTIDRCDEEAKICRRGDRDFDEDGEADWFCEGGTDCDDGDATRGSTVAEVCGDGVDNDCDEVIDESDCGAVAYDTCDDALDVSAGGIFEFTSLGARPDYQLGCAPAGRREQVITFELTEAQDVYIRAEGRSTTYLALRTTCDDGDTELECVGSFEGTIQRRALEAGRYYVLIGDIGGDLAVEVLFRDPTEAPTNETCATALDVSAGGSFPGTLIDVTDDADTSCGPSGASDLVYTFTTTEVRDLVVGAVSDTGDRVYIGLQQSCSDTATSLRCVNGATVGTRVHQLPAGTYFLVVEGSTSREFDFTLDVAFEEPTPPPAGDTCDNAIALTAPAMVTGNLNDKQDDIDLTCGFSYRDMVYELTLTERSDVEVVGEDTFLSVGFLDGCGPAATQLRCASGNPSRSRLRDLAPGTYFIVVESSAGGEFSLQVETREPTVPVAVSGNDDCDSAYVIPETGGLFQGNTETSLPDYETSGTICTTTAASKDVAFRLDLTTNKRVLATTDGSSFDTVLHLHTGMCATGEEEACDDDGGELSASRLDRVLAPGTHYFIVDGWGATRAGDYLFEVVVSDP